MSKPYSRDYESELLDKLRENGVTDEDILSGVLCWLSSDDTCGALEDVCDTYDIEY